MGISLLGADREQLWSGRREGRKWVSGDYCHCTDSVRRWLYEWPEKSQSPQYGEVKRHLSMEGGKRRES